MTIFYSALLGEHSVTLKALPTLPDGILVDRNQVDSCTSIELEDTMHVTPLRPTIQSLLEIDRSMTSLSHHPVDQSLICIETSTLQGLRLMLVRKQGKQLRVDADTVEDTARQETELTRELALALKPLAKDVAQDKATAEQAMAQINRQADPNKARRVLIAHLKTPATVVDGNEVEVANDGAPVLGSIRLRGQAVHKVQIQILGIDLSEYAVQARLLACDGPTDLFKTEDLGQHMLSVKVHDADNLFLLGQGASLGWPISIHATFDVTLNARGCAFHGSLIGIKDRRKLATELQAGVAERARALVA